MADGSKSEASLGYASTSVGKQRALAVAVLVCIVWGVFFPIVTYEFIDFDVPTLIVDNPHIRGVTLDNVQHILTSRCITSYYPVRTLSYAIDYQIWGLSPGGFKFTNGLIHSANVILVFWLVLRLFDGAGPQYRPRKSWWEILVATFAASIFGAHPVVVEPVAWVAGREELLMTLGALGCLHLHLAGRRLADAGVSRRLVVAAHAGAACCCLAACFSNAIGAVIPLLVVMWDLLMLPRPKWRRIVLATAPLLAIGISTILVKTIGYVQHPALEQADALSAAVERLGYAGDDKSGPPGIFDVDRLALALSVYWVNLRALVWPKDLTLSYVVPYPRGFWDVAVVAGMITAGLTCVVLWLIRRQRLALFGLLWFLLALGPVSQIVPYHIFHASRFLYLPLAGLAVTLAMVLGSLGRVRRPTAVRWSTIVAGACIILLLIGTAAKQVRVWRNDLGIWENAVRIFPEGHVVNQKLADALVQAEQLDRAYNHYQTALKLNVFDVKAAHRFARVLAACDDHGRRDYGQAVRLAEWAWKLTEGKDPSVRRTLAIVYHNAADTLRQRGEYQRAMDGYRQSIEADVTYTRPVLNLALLLVTCDDENLQGPEEAVRLVERAARMVDWLDVDTVMIMAVVYDRAGQSDRAISTIQRAISVAEAEGDIQLASILRGRLSRYRNQAPKSTNKN